MKTLFTLSTVRKYHLSSLLYVWMLFFYACTAGPVGDIQTFSVDPGHSSDKSFDDFYCLKEVIPLETTDSSAMTEIMKVVNVRDRIFISTWPGNYLYCFGKDGKFIHKLAKQGRGPGEYQIIQDFMITQNPDRIIIYDYLGKLIRYDWEGNFLEEENRDGYISGMEHLPNGHWLVNHGTWPTSTIRDTTYILRIADAEGNYLNGSFVLPKLISPVPKMPSALYKTNEEVYAIPITENTIYKYDYRKHTFDPAYTFKLKNHSIPSSLEQKEAQQPFFYSYYALTCEYIGRKTVTVNAFCLAEMQSIILIGEKTSGQVHVLPETFEDKENELTLNRYIQHTGFDGNMVVFTRPIQMLERQTENPHSAGSKLRAQLSEEDNPVLLVYEEK